jgi:ABC-type multidrug transport system ATPase subunit
MSSASQQAFPLAKTTTCTVTAINAGKRFNRDWIFRNFNYQFETGRSYAITGANGSGKSTLLQALAGSLHLSTGSTEYRISNKEQGISKDGKTGLVEDEQVYQFISIVAPYLELIEEMTAKEFLAFHSNFKPFISGCSIPEILATIGLEKAADKQIRYYSSGMKQRVKLAQAMFADTPVLLLDEPCTNLDSAGYALYNQLIETYCLHRLVIVSSNDAAEMAFCGQRLEMTDWK